MHLRRCAAAVVGLLTLAPALAACGSDTKELAAGDVVRARGDAQFIGAGDESVVALPIGRLEITLGKRTEAVAAKDNRQLEDLEAPDGNTFVPITWQYDADTFGDYAQFLGTDQSPVINLVSDGAKYRIPSPAESGQGSQSFYVLVSGSGKDVSLSVDFDGVEQSVDLVTGERDEGRAAPLYLLKPPRTKSRSCDANAKFDIDPATQSAPFRCRISAATRLPYAGGAWAEDGQSFLAVTVRTTLINYGELAPDRQTGALYYGNSVDSTFLLGKLQPTKVIGDLSAVCPDVNGICTSLYHLVFAAPRKAPKNLEVRQTYALRLGDGSVTDGDDATRLKARFRIPVK